MHSQEAHVGFDLLEIERLLGRDTVVCGDFGVPLGVNVESVSGFREEIDGVCWHAASSPDEQS